MKLIGGALIIVASTLLGLTKAASYSKRVQQLRQLQQCLKMLETDIVFGFTPLGEAFDRISKRQKGPVAHIFSEAAKQLSVHSTRTVTDIWLSVINGFWSETSLKLHDKTILTQLGAQLGSSDRNDQVKHIQLALRMLESEEKEAIEEQKIYPRIFQQLGILAGLLVVLLMY